jgi:hypothetical protein
MAVLAPQPQQDPEQSRPAAEAEEAAPLSVAYQTRVEALSAARQAERVVRSSAARADRRMVERGA